MSGNGNITGQASKLFIATIAALLATGVQAAEWTIAPYLWAPDVGADLTINEEPILGVDAEFSDILDKTDMAFMGHIEVRAENNWGAFFDIIYLDISDSGETSLGPGGPILGDLSFDSSLELGVYELAGFIRFGDRKPREGAFDVILGARQTEVEQVMNIVLPGPGGGVVDQALEISETDFMLGARIIGLFNDRWGYNVRLDYSEGGTDGIFNAFGGISYTFGKSGLFSLDLGYRYMTIELEGATDGGQPAALDLEMSGPLLGLIFQF